MAQHMVWVGMVGFVVAMIRTQESHGKEPMAPLSQGHATEEVSIDSLGNVDLESLLHIKVTTTSKRGESIADAPGVITVITAEDIKRYGITTMFEVMELATAIYPTSSYAKRYAVMSVRGMVQDQRNKYNLLLINGRQVKEYLQGGVEENMWSTFPLGAIERVEIVRGPGSVLYGPGAFTGVTNIITKKKDTQSIQASLGSGSRGQIRATAGGGISTPNSFLRGNAGYFEDSGWDWSSLEKYGTRMDEKLGRNEAAVYLHGGLYGMELDFSYSRIKDTMWMEVPLANAINDTTIQRFFLDLSYSRDLTKNLNAKANLTLGGKWDHRPLIKVVPMAAAGSDTAAMDLLGEFTLSYSHKDLHVLAAGSVVTAKASDVNYALDVQTLEKLPASDTNPSHPVPDSLLNSYSGYVQADYSYKIAKGVAGLQVNKVGKNALDLVPRVGLILRSSQNLGAKILFAQAYRAPTLFELKIDAPTLKGNPNLKSEKISTLDVQIFSNHSSIYAAITGYYSWITDPVSIRPNGVPGQTTYLNSDESLKAYGAEGEIKYSPIHTISTFASLAYSKVKPTTYMPRFIAKVGGAYEVMTHASFGVFGTFYGVPDRIPSVMVPPLPPINSPARDNTHLNPDPTSMVTLNANLLVHLSPILRWTKGNLDLYIRLINLLDRKVWIPEFNSRSSHINSFQSLDREPFTVYGGVSFGY